MRFKEFYLRHCVLNENTHILDHQNMDEDNAFEFLDLQADYMWVPQDDMSKFANQIKACELIYRNSKPLLTIKTVGLNESSDGTETFYKITDKTLLNKISQFFPEDKIIQGLIMQDKVEFGVHINEFNSQMNIFFYKKGAINALNTFLQELSP